MIILKRIKPYAILFLMADFQKSIDNALYIAFMYGTIDCSHHKMWCIDQMVRALHGGVWDATKSSYTSTNEYEDFIRKLEDGEDGPNTYSWDIGIAP